MNISGYSDVNTHDGNTTIQGNLVVQGNIFDEGGFVNIPDVNVDTHNDLEMFVGSTSTNGGVIDIIDKGYILKKHGNWRIMSGRVDGTLALDGYNVFTISFDIPTGDSILPITRIYMNGGTSQNVGGNSPNFVVVNASANASGKIRVTFCTPDKALWPQGVTVFTSARYCLSYLTNQSDPNQEGLEQVDSFVQNPMVEQLDANSFNIINVGNIQANTFNGGLILTNPLTIDLNANNNNINNVQQITSNVILTDVIGHLSGPNDILFSDNIDLQTNNIKNVGTLQTVSSITFNPLGTGIDMNSKTITMDGGNIEGTGTLQTVNIQNPIIGDTINFNSSITTDNKFIDLNGSFIDNCSQIANTGNIDIKTITSPITIAPTTSGNVELSTPSGNTTLKTVSGNLNIVSGLTSTVMNNTKIETFAKRLEESTSSSNKVDTVHIYDASGFTETVLTIFGNDYYDLLPNVTYIIHNQITVSNGFNFNVNTSIKGTSSSASITFDESTKNIIGFRAVDQNLIVQDITIIGGGGHFNDTNVGLFQGSNFDTGGLPPFYGRNKRCLISGCNIVAPFSLGKLQGFGTINILSNFINGGGAVPASIYTTHGLDVSDGLSFEMRGNKLVLFKGATGVSTLKMVNFIDSTLSPVVLGKNAVIITGNILHPRDNENAINFETNAIITLGTIGSNTFIRTGGTAPLINYDKATIYDNYNHPSIQNFEIVGNAGVVNSQPVLSALIGVSGSMNSATFTDIDYTITDMNPITTTKRFAYKLVMTGLTGSYSAGNYLKVSVGNNKGLIAKVDPVVLGTQSIYITDASQLSGTSFVEVDVSDVATGTSSTSFQLGTNSDNFEFIYLEKDEENVQFVLGINFDNDSKEDEIQFRLEFDETGTGNSFVGTANSTISALQAKDGRTASATLPFIKRMKNGDLVKLTYRYVDNTNTTVQSVIWSAK